MRYRKFKYKAELTIDITSPILDESVSVDESRKRMDDLPEIIEALIKYKLDDTSYVNVESKQVECYDMEE